MSRRPAVISLLIFVGACAAGTALPTDDWTRPFAGALADTRSRLITSGITGRTYEISVALPRGYEGTAREYPVLYAVDANGQFGSVVEAARLLLIDQLVPELIIVGIGYPVGHFRDASGARAVDLTPTPNRAWEDEFAAEFPEGPAREGSGGAGPFLRFLREELIPGVEREFRADAANRALFGHSFGGLFAIHALLRGEGTFQRFVAGSPSLWWDGEVTFEHEASVADSKTELPARVFFAVGALEESDPDVYWGHMVSDLERFLAQLGSRGYEGLEFESFVFPDETHTSVIPATISRGLRYIYAG